MKKGMLKNELKRRIKERKRVTLAEIFKIAEELAGKEVGNFLAIEALNELARERKFKITFVEDYEVGQRH